MPFGQKKNFKKDKKKRVNVKEKAIRKIEGKHVKWVKYVICQRGFKIKRYVVIKLLFTYHEKSGNIAFSDRYMTLSYEMRAL